MPANKENKNRGFAFVPIDDDFDFIYSNWIKPSIEKKDVSSCFVIMPFNQERPEKIYHKCIKPFIQEALQMNCVRVDEHQSMRSSITEHIKEHMMSCKFAVADISTDSFNNIVLRLIKDYKQRYTMNNSDNELESAETIIDNIAEITIKYLSEKNDSNTYEKPVTIDIIKNSDYFCNANVYYEIGFAHAIGKPMILIKDNKLGELPFDIKDYNVIVYDGDKILKTKHTEIVEDELTIALRNLLVVNGIIASGEKKTYKNNAKTQSIIGEWYGYYELSDYFHDVCLTIRKDKKKKYDITASITLSPKDKGKDGCKIAEYFRYNHKLNKHYNPEWEFEGDWIEFVGVVWVKEEKDNQNVLDYWLDAYAINETLQDNKLQVKIWDNMNKERKEVIFERTKS